jgi:hypothetical protein
VLGYWGNGEMGGWGELLRTVIGHWSLVIGKGLKEQVASCVLLHITNPKEWDRPILLITQGPINPPPHSPISPSPHASTHPRIHASMQYHSHSPTSLMTNDQ